MAKIRTWYSKPVYVIVALALAVGLLPVPVVGLSSTIYGQAPKLEVTITSPEEGTNIAACQNFAVTAKVSNGGDDIASSVSATLDISGPAKLAFGESATKELGEIRPGSTQIVNWTVHCKAPGDVTLNVTATASGGHSASASVTIRQISVCGIEIKLNPSPGIEVCPGDNFTVTGTVTNTGAAEITEAKAELKVTAGHASVTSTNPINLGTLAPGASMPVSWTLHCDSALCHGCNGNNDWVDVEATASGTCLGKPVSTTATLLKVVNQKWLIVEITAPPEGTDYCRCQEFFVNAEVRNCYDKPVVGTISIDEALLSSTGGELQVPPPAVQPLNIPPHSTATVPIPWHVHCSVSGELKIRVKYSGIADGCTLCDEDEVIVHQKDPAQLKVTISTERDCVGTCNSYKVTATVTNVGGPNAAPAENVVVTIHPSGDVTPNTPQSSSPFSLAAGAHKDFTVTFHCSGPADASFYATVTGRDEVCDKNLTATSETVNMNQVALDVKIITPDDSDTFSTCQSFCVTANITNNDTEPIVLDYAEIGIDATASLVAGESAVKLDNQILGEVIGTGDGTQTTFTATLPCTPVDSALPWETGRSPVVVTDGTQVLSDNGLGVFTGDGTGTINYDTGKISVTFTNPPASGAKILVDYDCNEVVLPGATEQVSWTVHCKSSGDSEITVFVYVDEPCDLRCPKQVRKDTITVHQETPAELAQEILSPRDTIDTYIGTSQDFALTAKVMNLGEADAIDVDVTLNHDAKVAVVSPAETQHVAKIPGKGFVIVTWTLHCESSGDTDISVTSVGKDENSLDYVISPATSVKVHQYPAAHLEVDVSVDKDTVTVCDTFTVTAKVTNTGEADAWDVAATLSVEPEGSVRLAEGEKGYTKRLSDVAGGDGTLTGHGVNESATFTWLVHCKQACESTITVTASGYDEYGWYWERLLGWQSLPGRAIDERNIEPASVTVKQVMPAQLVVEITFPDDGAEFPVNEKFAVSATITNIGEETAKGVVATIDGDPQPAFDLPGRAKKIIIWENVSFDTAGYHLIEVKANGRGAISGKAVGASDNVIVKIGADPDPQLSNWYWDWTADGVIDDNEILEAVFCWLTKTPHNDYVLNDRDILWLVDAWVTEMISPYVISPYPSA